jgi:uncharacterized protein GlcG (DUF336 family)
MDSKNVLRSVACCVALVCAPLVTRAEELGSKPVLTLSVAQKIVEAAREHASQNGWNVCIAIVDDGGHLIHFQRMDGTQSGSVQVSQKKAETAARFKRPTKVFEEQVLTAGRSVILALPGALPLEGGVPITVDGQIIGAIGVSGVTSAQDGQIAQAGLDALPKILGREVASSSTPAPVDFQTTESGLKYRILKEGSGDKPTAESVVVCHYRGWLDSGEEFDSSLKRGEPTTFPLNGVIKGWTEGLQLVQSGGKIELEIPSELGYGARGIPGVIPADSTLHFEVELLEIKN